MNIFLVDDSPRFLETAAAFIRNDKRLNIIGTAASGEEALEKINELKPDLVLLDISMPGMSGLETARLIKAQASPVKVVILTLNDEPQYRSGAEEAGADGFISKNNLVNDFFNVMDKMMTVHA